MLRIGVVSVFPEMFPAVTGFGIAGRAVTRGLMEVRVFNPRDHAPGPHRSVDDRPYGGGPGMVMRVEPLRGALRAARDHLGQARVLCLSPQGRRIDQAGIVELAGSPAFILVAGRYEGIDERFVLSEGCEEWSIGDLVLSGGELPAMLIIDAVARLLPGALGNEDSARQDSFADGLLDHPHFTRPEEVDGLRVPEVLLSGDHEAIRRWRLKQALGRTWKRRPDMLARANLNEEQQALLDEFLEETGHAGPQRH